MSDELLNKILAKLIDSDQYMRENMVTRHEFENFKVEIYSHIDGFIKLHETLDVELVVLRSKYERLEERLGRVEIKLGLQPV